MKGLKLQELVLGTGPEVSRDDIVLVELTISLNQGTVVQSGRFTVNLKKRTIIAGIRYGIVGMRPGGVRELRISPHLAHGVHGVPDRIPGNAVVRCRLELVEILEGEEED